VTFPIASGRSVNLNYGGADPAFGGVTFPIAIGTFFQSQDTEFVLNYGGAEGSRTPDLLTASQAFSQLNYGPRNQLLFDSSAITIRTNKILDIRSAFLVFYLFFPSCRFRPSIIFLRIYQTPRSIRSGGLSYSAIVLIEPGFYILCYTDIIPSILLTL
jgi:hypothetical protein